VFDPRGFLLALQYKFCAMRFNQTTLHMQKLQQTFEISAKIYKMSDSDENSHDSHGTFCSRRAGDSRPVQHSHEKRLDESVFFCSDTFILYCSASPSSDEQELRKYRRAGDSRPVRHNHDKR
jgi:hypothetical protein